MLKIFKKYINNNSENKISKEDSPRKSKEYWESHADFEAIKKYVNFIDKTLDDGDKIWTLSEYISSIKLVCDYYLYLEQIGFISSLPFFTGDPKGLRDSATVILPFFSIRDYLIGNIHMNISYMFNTHNEPAKSLPQTDENVAQVGELIDYLKKSFPSHPKFQELLFFNQNTETTISFLKEKDFAFDATAEAFQKRIDE